MSEPSLFDSLDDQDVSAGATAGQPRPCIGHVLASSSESKRAEPTDSAWQECPLEVFLAMSERRQLDYCARRDDDSARFAATEEQAAWYRWRAATYRQMIEGLK